MWTPIYALGADLTACRATLLSKEREWARKPDPEDPSDKGWSQEQQAECYLEHALHRYMQFNDALGHFMVRHGGHRVLSSEKAEEDVSDATHRIRWHNAIEATDSSVLQTLDRAVDGELDHFLTLVERDRRAATTPNDWIARFRECACTWNVGEELEREFFATPRTTPTIYAKYQLHATVTACNDYLAMIDDEWSFVVCCQVEFR